MKEEKKREEIRKKEICKKERNKKKKKKRHEENKNTEEKKKGKKKMMGNYNIRWEKIKKRRGIKGEKIINKTGLQPVSKPLEQEVAFFKDR